MYGSEREQLHASSRIQGPTPFWPLDNYVEDDPRRDGPRYHVVDFVGQYAARCRKVSRSEAFLTEENTRHAQVAAPIGPISLFRTVYSSLDRYLTPHS